MVPRGRRMLTPYVSRLGPRAGQPGAIRPRRRGRFESPAPAPIDGLILSGHVDPDLSDPALIPEPLEVVVQNETGAAVASGGSDVRGPDALSYDRLRPGAGPQPAESGANRTEPEPIGPERRPKNRTQRGRAIHTEPVPETRSGPGPENRSESAGIEPVRAAVEPQAPAPPADSSAAYAAPRRPTPSADHDASARSRSSGIESTISVPASTAPSAPGPKPEPRTHASVADDRAGVRPRIGSGLTTSGPFDALVDRAGQFHEAIVRTSRSGAVGRAGSHAGEPSNKRLASTPPEPMWDARPAPPPATVGRSPSQDAGRSHLSDVPNADVTVTIGRIEVSVPPTPPVRPRPPSRPRRQPPSLTEYLEARARGLAG